MSGINLVHFPLRKDLSNEYSHHALFFSVGRLVTNLTSQYNTLVVIRMYQTNVSNECIKRMYQTNVSKECIKRISKNYYHDSCNEVIIKKFSFPSD